MSGTRLAFANTGFLLFRALEFISPTLALRAEVLVVRICNAWRARQGARTFDSLLEENAELNWQIRDLSRKASDRDQLAVECAALRERCQYLQGLEQAVYEVDVERAHQVEAAGHQRDLVFNENAKLKLDNEALAQDLVEAGTQVQSLSQLVERLEVQLREARRVVEDCEKQLEPRQAFYRQVQEIAESCAHVQVAQPTQLDHQIETLLPLLLNQIGQAEEFLALVKEDIDPTGSIMIGLRSFERILGQMKLALSNVPVAFKRHTAWQTHIDHLVLLQEVH